MDILGYKIYIFHNLYNIALSFSMVHGYSVLVFTSKYLVSVSLTRAATSAPALFWLNRQSSETTPELQWVVPVIYGEDCEYNFFEYYALSLSLFRVWLKIALPKSKSTQKFRDIKVCASVKTHRRETLKFIVANCKIDLHYKLQLLAYEYQKQSARDVLRKDVLKNFPKVTEKHLYPSLFLTKLQVSDWKLYGKIDSGRGIFQWILLNI